MLELFNVTDTMRNGLAYDGATPKFGITVEGVNYLVKRAKKHFSSEIYSEYVASHFIQNVGLSAHGTYLGNWNDSLVVVMRDFTSSEAHLRTFGETQQSSVEGGLLTSLNYTYDDVLTLLASHTKMSAEARAQALVDFWNMYICDAILANRDRVLV